MRHFKQLLSSISAGLLAVSLFAASAAARDAKIVKLVGSGAATVTLPNGSQVAATEGMSVPENSTIETKAGVELYVEATPGVVATMKANSKIKVEASNASLDLDAVLDLQQGNIISQIDPKAKVKYGVRTPKGVAAARGTVFSTSVVTVNGIPFTVTMTLSGSVAITPPPVNGVVQASVTVVAGTASGGSGGGAPTPAVSLAAAAATLGVDVTAVATAAVSAVAVVAQAAAAAVPAGATPTVAQQAAIDVSAGLMSTTMTTVVTAAPASVNQVAASAAAAAPQQAASIVQSAVASAAAAGQSSAAVATLAGNVASAAAQGAASTAATPAAAAAIARATDSSMTSIANGFRK